MKPQPTEYFRPLAVEWYSPETVDRWGESQPGKDIFGVYGDEEGYRCPYGAPGDRLWGKEAIRLVEGNAERAVSEYAADGGVTVADAWPWKLKVLPSMFCPRGLSRITLEVTGIRVEQLQAISEADCEAELGAERYSHGNDAYPKFRALWESINGAESWAVNPWVWVVEFKSLLAE